MIILLGKAMNLGHFGLQQSRCHRNVRSEQTVAGQQWQTAAHEIA
jgi:hypothetical protein